MICCALNKRTSRAQFERCGPRTKDNNTNQTILVFCAVPDICDCTLLLVIVGVVLYPLFTSLLVFLRKPNAESKRGSEASKPSR